jgi:hypothetical protein
MTLSDNLLALADAVGDECQSLRDKIGPVGTLITTDKTNLVHAVNELKTALDTVETAVAAANDGASISDSTTTTTTTWSSTKINAALQGIIAGAPSALNTLAELATAIGNDAAFATTVQQKLDQKLSINTAGQVLNPVQSENIRTNINAAKATDIFTDPGFPDVDFVATFNQGLL